MEKTMITHATEVRDIEIADIIVMFHRARAKEGFEGLKASMADPNVGLLVPVQVRPVKGKRADGKKWELIKGEGRITAASELGWKTVPAIVKDAKDAELAGMFLAENMIREPIPWAQKGRMIKAEVEAGRAISEIAASLHISENVARKYLRVVNKTASGLEDVVSSMSANQAEAFTTLPASGQTLVIDVARETGVPVLEVTRKAKESKERVSKAGLLKALRGIDDALGKMRQRAKMFRVHHQIGPENVAILLGKPAFARAIKEAGVNLARWEEATK